MKYFLYTVLSLVILVTMVSQMSFARKATSGYGVQPSGQECEMIENVQIYVNFNNQEESDPKSASSKMDEYLEKISDLAKKSGVSDLHIQSYNYSLNNNSSGCGSSSGGKYQFYGNINYIISPETVAADFMSLLEENNFKANLNVNAHRQCQ